jgi:UDP-N-acetylglucosamine--N-acetylmuramyl-(pentapeptide) pyrophosphoryl-undecaprenol N-acetylglucosamine transferase
MMERRILIAGGGTGGHVYPALAMIEALKKKGNFQFLYVGGKNGIETRIVPRYQIPLKTIWISGFARSLTIKNLTFPVKLLMSLYQSWNIVRKFKPDVAVGTGGYVSGPVLFVAAKKGVPVLIQEQDVYPGVTTRLLAKHAWRICLSFEGTRKYFLQHSEKLAVIGNPVRQDLTAISHEDAQKHLGLVSGKVTLFIFGGSQGARSINTAMINILPDLTGKYDLQVIWQTGESQFTVVQERFRYEGKNIKMMPYIQEMDAAYAAADIVICRAGAIALAELAIVAKPAVLIPYPFAAGNHQEHNSRMIAEAGAALMVAEKADWEAELRCAIETLLENSELREQQSSAWKKLARPNAADLISEEILKLMNR